MGVDRKKSTKTELR